MKEENTMNHNVKWFVRITLLGIITNILFVVALILVPVWFLSILNIPLEPDDAIWARFSGVLLLLLSIFYLPATWDLNRYRVNAWLMIFPSRTFGAIFFLVAVFVEGEPIGFLIAAAVDAFFAITCFVLLLLVTLEEKQSVTQSP